MRPWAGNRDFDQALEWLAGSRRAVALTGAGLSVASGVPAFRGAQGLWDRYDPLEYAHIQAFRADPAKVWRMLAELARLIDQARPNPGHLALAELEARGKLAAVITQNVDNLHQAAGSRRVIEFHGNGASLVCLDCRRTRPSREVALESLPPRCDCGGILKPKVIFFGEPIPQEALTQAVRAVQGTDLMLVVGTSAVVAPASLLPGLAARQGARIIEIGLESTELTGRAADLTILGRAEEILPDLVQGLDRALPGRG